MMLSPANDITPPVLAVTIASSPWAEWICAVVLITWPNDLLTGYPVENPVFQDCSFVKTVVFVRGVLFFPAAPVASVILAYTETPGTVIL
jgi:hypothetical protein